LTAFVVDASTILAAFFAEAHTPAARAFLASLKPEDILQVPSFFLTECTSNIRRKVYDGAISQEDAEAVLAQILRIPATPVHRAEQHLQALRIAHRRGSRRAYDEHYLAIAMSEGAQVVTIDGGMRQGAVENGIRARLLR
jgi:predicted nucleic acid-binding protein